VNCFSEPKIKYRRHGTHFKFYNVPRRHESVSQTGAGIEAISRGLSAATSPVPALIEFDPGWVAAAVGLK
jgi:hypothetical protein